MKSRRFDRFLAPPPRRGTHAWADLGRDYVVVRETWRLADDPAAVPPQRLMMASGRTAAEAADLARELAANVARHGFHKPTGRWWASDGALFHQFSIKPRATGLWAGALALAFGALVVAAWTRPARPRRRGSAMATARGG
jgi:hypothetical protein